MIFQKLFINDFMPFDEAEIDLDNQGIVGVFGKNETSSGFDSNGSGKSSLWDALVWCIYGKTIRGLASDDVIRKDRKRATVTLHLEANGDHISIERTRGSSAGLNVIINQSKINGSTASQTQEKINHIMGMDYQTFLMSVFFGQDCMRFAESTDSEQKAILDKILGMELFKNALESVKSDVSKVRNGLTLLDTELKIRASKIDDFRHKIVQNWTFLQDFEAKKQGDILAMEAQAKENGKVKQDSETKLNEVEASLAECEATYKIMSDQDSKIERISDPSYSIQDIKEANKILELKFHKIRSNVCAACGQGIDKDKAEEMCALLCGDIASNDTKLKNLNKALNDYQTQQKDLKESNLVKADFFKLIGDLKADRRVLEAKASGARIRAGEISAKLEFVRNQTCPIDNTGEIEERIAHLDIERQTIGTEIESAKEKIKDLEFWEVGFGSGGIKSFLLDSVMDDLTNSANQYAQTLLDGSIRIEFTNQKELKSGDLREKIEVKARNRDGADIYQGNSAGERQRIDLCIALALNDLARQRCKNSVNILILDEAFERLDSSGVERILILLRGLTAVEGKSIFIVSHLDSLQSQFQKKLTIVKRKGISSIEKQEARPPTALGEKNLRLERKT